MVNFILPADSKITIVEDTSYLLNNALRVNAVFSASGVVASGSDVLRVNLPNVGEHAELGWFDTGSDHSATAAATVKNTSLLRTVCTTSLSSLIRPLLLLSCTTSRAGSLCRNKR